MAHDPRLDTREWKAIRAYWNQVRPAQCQAPGCVRPDMPIVYGGQRGPWHLDVGHIVPRAEDPRLVWTVADTRPEHVRCSRRAGAQLGNRGRGPRRRPARRAPLITSQQW